MRLVDLEKQKRVRKQVSIQAGLTYGVLLGGILFILLVAVGFFEALLFGLIAGGFLFGLIYFLRELTHKGVERKRSKLEIHNPQLDVTIDGEIGVLEIQKEKLIYRTLTPGGANKYFELDINENLFMAVGIIEYRMFQKFQYKGIESGFIMVKEMPHGIPRQFIFYNIDNVIEKVDNLIKEVNQFKDN